MLSFPNAKINIGLNIIERRPDNFHNLETAFFPIELSDVLEILKNENPTGSKAELRMTGLAIQGEPENNLCVKAYHLLDKEYDLPPVRIILHKIVPTGAGLGGGSSDGAFALKLLNDIFDLRLNKSELEHFAGRLGSDCAFFIENKPAFGTGKGNILDPISLNLSGYHLVLVKPDVFVGTAEAYAGIIPRKPERSLKELIQLPVVQWKEKIVNDFEEGIFEKHPEIRDIKEKLYTKGALYASMSGSGSAVYGIFRDATDLKDQFKGYFVWEGRVG